MNIKEIKPASIQNFDIPKFKPKISERKAEIIAPQDVIEISKPDDWSKDILAVGLKSLENKIQLANNSYSMPLDKVENSPIESYVEALEELKFFKTDKFKSEASAAQANISADIVKELLMELA